MFGGSQAVRRINDAVLAALPRLVERVRVVHVTGEGGYAAAVSARETLPAELRDRYRPHPFLHDDMTSALAAADLAVGRAGASTLAEAAAFALPTAIVPYPHAAGHQRRNAEAFAEAGAAILIEDEDLDADRLVEVAGLLADPAAARRDVGRRARLPGPTPRTPSPTSCSRSRCASRSPTQAEIEATARGGGRDRCARTGLDRDPRSTPLATGTDIQRRIGVKTSRDEPLARFTTMRVGGPADLFAVVAQPVRAAGAGQVRARARDPVHAPRTRLEPRDRGRGDPRARDPGPRRGDAARRRPLSRRRRRPDGPGGDRDPEGRADRARVRARDPGHGRWRGVGERRRPRGRDRVVLESATVLARGRHGARAARRRARFGYRDSRFKDADRCPPAVPPRSSWRDLPAHARRPRGDQGAASTRSAAGARRTSRWDPVGGFRVPQPRRRLGGRG